jgi:hypothetical protein
MCVFPLLFQLALADTIWFAEFIVLKLKGAPRAMSGLGGGLNRSTQHFIFEGQDGV